MIRVDAVWLAVQPLDMRAGTESALVRVVNVFGAAHPHHAYLFANRRANNARPQPGRRRAPRRRDDVDIRVNPDGEAAGAAKAVQ